MLIPLESPTKCYAISLLGKPGVLYHDIMMKPSPTPCPTPRHDWIQPQPAHRGATQGIPLPTSADFRPLRLLPGQLPLSDPLIFSDCLIPSDSLIDRPVRAFHFQYLAGFIVLDCLIPFSIHSCGIGVFYADDLSVILSDDLCYSVVLKVPSTRVVFLVTSDATPTRKGLKVSGVESGALSQGICCTSGILRSSENLTGIRGSGVSGGLIGEGAFWDNPFPAAGNGICCYLTSSPTPLPGLALHCEVTQIAGMIASKIRRVIACTPLPESL